MSPLTSFVNFEHPVHNLRFDQEIPGGPMGKTLYVRNLSDLMDSDALEEMFSSVGDVLSSSVVMKQVRDRLYRVGYVTMGTDQQAADVIERFHGVKNSGQDLIVTEDVPHVPNAEFVAKKK